MVYKTNLRKILQNVLVFLFGVVLSFESTWAQATPAPATQYATQNLFTSAAALCSRYTSYTNYFPAGTPGGGGGSVPVDFQSLLPVLLSIERNSALSANETRQGNLMVFCTEYQNLAAASARITQEAQRALTNIANTCSANRECLLQRVFEGNIQREIQNLQNLPMYGREISQLVLSLNQPKAPPTYNYELVQRCNQAREQGRNPIECITAPTAEDIILAGYENSRSRIETEQTELENEFVRGNGVIGNRRCTVTASGAAPATVPFYSPDCLSYNTEPGVLTEEALRQVVALPYNQAFSDTAVLGTDEVLNNISTRVGEGNLIGQYNGANFTSTVNTGGSGIGGPGTSPTGPVATSSTYLASIEANYKKILQNVGTMISLYAAADAYYASSTTPCAKMPVATRSTIITNNIRKPKTGFETYRDTLIRLWNSALRNPNTINTELIVYVNTQARDGFNQPKVEEVYNNVRQIFQACAQYATPTPTATTTTTTTGT